MDIKLPKAVTAARTIGAILIDSGKLSPADAERVLRLQKENNLRFGDAALLLGLVTADDIAQALAQQYNYPYLTKGSSKISAEVIAAYEPFGAAVEALRALRTQLMLRWFADDAANRCLAVCSAGRGEGRSHLCANLAVIFAQLGERTLIIDADMRQPRQHALFGMEAKTGLSSILAGRSGLEAIQSVSEFGNLAVLPAGPVPPNPQELLTQAAFAQLMETVSTQYDVVLVDTPAATRCDDAQAIAVKTRAALLIARKHKSRLEDTHRYGLSLAKLGVNLVGIVLKEF